MHHFNAVSYERLINKLKHDFGAVILAGLADNNVQEIQLNASGRLYFNQPNGNVFKGFISEAQRISIICGLAGLNHDVVTREKPVLEGQLPNNGFFKGERFTAHISPASDGPGFALRKKPAKLWRLSDYIETGRLKERLSEQLKTLVFERQNIIVCGGPGSGKSTVTNALIAEMVEQTPEYRLLILEDTPELQCTAENHEFLRTTNNLSMQHLLKHTMRMSPDRILVGEVRGAEALDLLKAWNTGCPGGIATIHANGPIEAIQRLQDCAMEAGLVQPPLSLIKHTVDAVVFVTAKGNQKGFIQQIVTREELFQ